MEIKKAVCSQCHNNCPVQIRVENNRLLGVDPDPDYPAAKAFYPVTQACRRRRAMVEYFHHPGRLNYPLKRAGERGQDRWQQISWEQALDEIAGRLREIIAESGPEAVGGTSGTGRTHDEIRQRFFNLLGSPNHVGMGAICYGPQCTMAHAVFGWRIFPVIRQDTKLAVVWGGGGPNYWDVFWSQAKKARRERGMKIMVIDPRETEAVRHADLWLQVRPGTDAALAMGLINYVIEHDLYDKAFVDKWCYGFDELKARVADYSIAKTAQITWIPEDTLRQAAEWYGTLTPAVTSHGEGIEEQAALVEVVHARYALNAIMGNVETRGGDVFAFPYPDVVHVEEVAVHERLSPEQREKTLGGNRFRLISPKGFEVITETIRNLWGREAYARTAYECYAHAPSFYRAMLTGEPYRVRACITQASNPLLTQPNVNLVYRALKSLDLYVVHDFFLTPSAQLADYVLPATTYMERPWIWSYAALVGSERALPKSIPGQYDRRDDYDLWRELGVRLGQEAEWPWETLEDYYDYRLAPSGLTFAEFMAQGRYLAPPKVVGRHETDGFATPTGKVELYCTTLEKLGYDPLPRYYEPPASPYSTPELAKEYPLVLITGGRVQPFYHSEYRQVATLRKVHPEPQLQINPETARELGIEDGEWVWIETPLGRITQKATYFAGIDPRVVHAEHAWWFPEEEGAEPNLYGVFRSNANILVDEDPEICNQISGGYPTRGLLCKVYRK